MAAAASASGGDTPKQLLSIIRDFAYEKSHGERGCPTSAARFARSVACRAGACTWSGGLDAGLQLEAACRTSSRSQVQAAIAADSILALRGDDLASPGGDLEGGTDLDAALKSKGDSEREEFISKMYEMNAKIRQFQQMVSLELAEHNHCEPSTEESK
ncbi:unnamed protein product [Miscanthus lutarioriparius]|uniref:Uncharacterized protein n=1 Tax=Miscanthus lutarioriparius TaxID=422564 RepID=A0A811S7R6_9POAL|nr:unnamed protein product [Miscanthus lutarioriparius]